jgi:two-component system response regulator YesN
VVGALRAQPQLRVSQLAPMVDLSPNYLERLFKKHVGTSITEYSMEMRLLRASELLVTTFHSVKEIRNEVGIPDASNFAHRFKRRFGLPPSKYRKVRMHVLTNK